MLNGAGPVIREGVVTFKVLLNLGQDLSAAQAGDVLCVPRACHRESTGAGSAWSTVLLLALLFSEVSRCHFGFFPVSFRGEMEMSQEKEGGNESVSCWHAKL